MVRIIKRGSAPVEREYEKTCSNCNTVFVATENEFLKEKSIGDWHPTLNMFLYGHTYRISCPLCNKELVFDELD